MVMHGGPASSGGIWARPSLVIWRCRRGRWTTPRQSVRSLRASTCSGPTRKKSWMVVSKSQERGSWTRSRPSWWLRRVWSGPPSRARPEPDCSAANTVGGPPSWNSKRSLCVSSSTRGSRRPGTKGSSRPGLTPHQASTLSWPLGGGPPREQICHTKLGGGPERGAFAGGSPGR